MFRLLKDYIILYRQNCVNTCIKVKNSLIELQGKMTTIYLAKLKRMSSQLGGLGVFAGQRFKAGDILSCDIVNVSDNKGLVAFLEKNQSLRSRLYPRGNVDTLVKVISNTFGMEEPFSLGEWTSFYNHSCTPNAMIVWSKRGYLKAGTIVALRDIRKNEEICIYYGYKTTHTAEWSHFVGCKGCDTDDDSFEKFAKQASELFDMNKVDEFTDNAMPNLINKDWVQYLYFEWIMKNTNSTKSS